MVAAHPSPLRGPLSAYWRSLRRQLAHSVGFAAPAHVCALQVMGSAGLPGTVVQGAAEHARVDTHLGAAQQAVAHVQVRRLAPAAERVEESKYPHFAQVVVERPAHVEVAQVRPFAHGLREHGQAVVRDPVVPHVEVPQRLALLQHLEHALQLLVADAAASQTQPRDVRVSAHCREHIVQAVGRQLVPSQVQRSQTRVGCNHGGDRGRRHDLIAAKMEQRKARASCQSLRQPVHCHLADQIPREVERNKLG
eukprot:2488393-Rhodomonas_salina.2